MTFTDCIKCMELAYKKLFKTTYIFYYSKFMVSYYLVLLKLNLNRCALKIFYILSYLILVVICILQKIVSNATRVILGVLQSNNHQIPKSLQWPSGYSCDTVTLRSSVEIHAWYGKFKIFIFTVVRI